MNFNFLIQMIDKFIGTVFIMPITMKSLYYSILTLILFPYLISSLFTIPVTNDFDEFLPGDVQPEKYVLDIFTAMENSRSQFWGTVFITVKCLRKTNKIILHVRDLLIFEKEVKIKLLGSDPPFFIEVRRHEYNLKYEQYIMILWKDLDKDQNYEITIQYYRPPDKVRITLGQGYEFIFYEFPEGSKDEKQLAYTWMGKSAARAVFPCFDQLGMKATFKISLRRQKNVEGLSNTEKIPTKPEFDPFPFIKDEFTETVRMEANSVAIVISNYQLETSKHSPSQPDIRILADTFFLERLRPIISLANQIFQFFSDYFKVSYPLSKLDVVALPNLVENAEALYGVIYVSQDKTLKGLEETSHSDRYKLVSEVCHVMSQQWIGHTVTVLQWMDDIIHTALNIFLQTQCVTEIEPKWKLHYIESDIINSFMKLSEMHVKDPQQPLLVTGISPTYFEDITNKKLKKTYHLTRMIHFILGPDIFQKSITNYVEKFKFSNALFGDLWATFTNTVNTIRPHILPNISIGEIMMPWVHQDGYPLIIVNWISEKKQISIKQVPFTLLEEEEEIAKKIEKNCWLIPLSYATETESKSNKIDNNVRKWLTCEDDQHLFIDMDENDWFLLDLNVNVISRVYYDESIWIGIQKALVNNEEPEVFHAFIRARLISDMFVFAELGKLSYSIVLDAMTYLPREDQYENWTLALREFDYIRSLLLQSSVYKYFEKYVQRLLDPVLKRKKFEYLTQNEGVDLDLKIAIIKSSCKYGVEACRQKSVDLIKNWKSGKENLDSVPIELQRILHCEGIKNGDRKHWDFMWKVYNENKNPRMKDDIFKALSCSKSGSTLKRVLGWILDKEMIWPENSFAMFHNLSSNRKAYKMMRKFFITNYDRIVKINRRPGYIYRYWEELFNATVKQKDLDQLLDFARLRGVANSSYKPLQRSMLKARRNIAWLERNETILKTYFKSTAPKKGWPSFKNERGFHTTVLV